MVSTAKRSRLVASRQTEFIWLGIVRCADGTITHCGAFDAGRKNLPVRDEVREQSSKNLIKVVAKETTHSVSRHSSEGCALFAYYNTLLLCYHGLMLESAVVQEYRARFMLTIANSVRQKFCS